MFKPHLFIGLLCVCPAVIFSSTPGDATALEAAIVSANANIDTSITFANSFDFTGFTGVNLTPVNILSTSLPANRTIIINGNGNTLTGTGPSNFRGFFIRGGSGSVAIQNLTFNQCTGMGGNGGSGGGFGGNGGGGGGLGGGLYINNGATVTLTNLSFTNCMAQGGSGAVVFTQSASRSGGGGGGFRGDGGSVLTLNLIGAGGLGGGGLQGRGGNNDTVDLLNYYGGTGGGDAFDGIDVPGGGGVDGTAGGGDFSGAGFGAGGVGDGGNGANGTTGAGGAAAGHSGNGRAAGTAGMSNTTVGSIGGGGAGGGGAQGRAGEASSGSDGGPFGGGGSGGGVLGVPSDQIATLGGAGKGGFAGGGAGGAGNFSNDLIIATNGGDGGFAGGGGGGGNLDMGLSSQQGLGGQGGYGGGNGANGADGQYLVIPPLGGGGGGFGGALFVEEGAIVTFTGTLSFSNSSVMGGTGANSGLSDGYDIFAMSNSELFFDLNPGFNLTMANPIAGNQGRLTSTQSSLTLGGGLHKLGFNTMTLVGANTYTGMTSVEVGELRINGSVVTNVTVSNGATLSGNCSILKDITTSNGGNLTNSGIVSPGVNGIGTIFLDGNYVQTSDGRLLIDLTPAGQSDRIYMMSNGIANLAGTLELVFGSGNYVAGTQYTIINAPTGGTTFNTLVKSGVNANAIDIRIDYSSVIITILNTLLFNNQTINPGVPSIVANALQNANITPGSDLATIVFILGNLSNKEVNRALISLSPVAFGALEWINERNNSYVADLLSQHLFELCCSPRECCSCDCNTSVWMNVFGNLMDNAKWLDNLQPFEANAFGALGGIDFCCGPWYFGASGGYTHTHLIWKNLGGKGNLDSYYGALYGSWQCDCFSVDLSAIGGGSDQHLNRRIVFDNIDRVAKSNPSGYFVTGHLGLKAKLGLLTNCGWCNTTFEPFALSDYHYYTRQKFKEKGANSINLNVLSKDQHFIRAEAGMKVYSNWMNECYCFAPYFGMSWVGEFPIGKSHQKATFIDQTYVMDTISYDSYVNLASPQAGVKWTWCDGASLQLGYKGLFNNKTHINEVEGRLEWLF